jgi:uncharacterized membrane protein
MRAEESAVVDRPVEKVFGYVADSLNLPEWSGAAVEVRDLKHHMPGEPGEGDEFTPVHKFLGKRIEEHVEVTAYETNRRITNWSTGGPMPLEIDYVFEEAPEDKTRLTVSMDTRPAGFFRLIGPVFKVAVKRQLRKDLQTLKGLLEARG